MNEQELREARRAWCRLYMERHAGTGAGGQDLGRVRVSLEVARRRGRFYEPVPVDVLGALLAVVDATSWFVEGPGDLASLVAALEPFAPAEEDGCPHLSHGDFTLCETERAARVDGLAFNERMQERERARVLADLGIEVVDLPVSDAVSSDEGGRPVSLPGAENGPQILSRPASLVDRTQARRVFNSKHECSPTASRLGLALLAELEQAERERGELETELVRRQDNNFLEEQIATLEARLARVPALVQALREASEYLDLLGEQVAASDAREAVAEWEQA